MTSIIYIRITDIPGSRANNELFFLNTMHKIWRVVCQERAYFTASLCNAGLGNIWL